MPRYEYKCIKCGTFAVRIVNMTNRDKQVCIHCDSNMARVPSVPAKPNVKW